MKAEDLFIKHLCCHCCKGEWFLRLFLDSIRLSLCPQAVFPRGWPVPGRPSAQGVCPLPATQRTSTEPTLPLLATEPGHLWQKQSPQHFPPHHPVPVLHGELAISIDSVNISWISDCVILFFIVVFSASVRHAPHYINGMAFHFFWYSLPCILYFHSSQLHGWLYIQQKLYIQQLYIQQLYILQVRWRELPL